MTHNMDRRIKRTRKLLGQALIDLLQAQPLAEISIKEITDQADVAYSTFFRNFESKEALLLNEMREMVERLKGKISAADGVSFGAQTRASIRAIFEAIQADPTRYRLLFRAPSAQPTLRAFKQELVAQNLRLIRQMDLSIRPGLPPIDLVLENGMNQLFGMINWWLDQELLQSQDEMVDYYELLVVRPTWTLLLGEAGMRRLLDL